jgi:hypothetical protein
MINRKSQRARLLPLVGMMLMASATVATTAYASSHREAPYITSQPKVDGTDFYMFNSYEAGRESMVTLIANYLPLQDAYGGPNYFSLDPNALYEIHIDNNGDAVEDITFQFRFTNKLNNLTVPVNGKNISIPLVNKGSITPQSSSNANIEESFTVTMVKGTRRGANSMRQLITNPSPGAGNKFLKPTDNIGNKSIPSYDAYANQFIYNVNIPGCGSSKIFVGQRKDSFAVNLGEIFDLINTNPIGEVDGENDDLADKNVTTLAMEVPKSCLISGSEPIIGGWTTASLRQARLLNPKPSSNNNASKEGGAWTQVSRLGMPLVNEVIIGLTDKDKFNASQPKDDGQFADYVTNPALPALIEILFADAGVKAPTNFPRTDLVAAFLTGVDGLNQPAVVKPSEMLRLNTSIAAKAAGLQEPLGVLMGDTAGFPNGRRPGDDVVDIELRVAMGVLSSEKIAPSGQLKFTDGALQNAAQFTSTFPYLTTPLAGATSK